MKDRLRFNGYPLPVPRATEREYAVEGNDGVEEQLEVRADGYLWRDRSSSFLLDDIDVEEPSWEKAALTGELLVIHHGDGAAAPLRWSLYFVDGQLREIHRVDGWRRCLSPNET